MRKVISTFLCLSLCLSATGQEANTHPKKSNRGSNAGYATRSATALSMMGWGFLLAGSIATISILIKNDHSHSE